MHFNKMSIYQIYPRSFYDSNGDGVGDLAGITAKLDYLKELGIDMIWITPFFLSPQRDNGYDVADYYQIDPLFGTMADFEELLAKGKALGIEFMLDMVFNHTSTEHAWFQSALAGDEAKQAYYIFRDGAEIPTNWLSKFGGSAWQYVSHLDKHYLHLFDVTQADLNWKNEAVRQELIKVINYWIDKGVMGFRFDVINLIDKGDFIDDNHGDGRKYYTDGVRVNDYLTELNKLSFGKNPTMVTVGEMSSTTIEAAVGYSARLENRLRMIFNFHHLKVDYEAGEKWSVKQFSLVELKKILFDWQLGVQAGDGWQALFWSNHDQPRVVSRFGASDPAYRVISAKMLANAMYLLRGTPFIYQGEEIGLPNASFMDIHQYRDVETHNYYQILREKGLVHDAVMKILAVKSRDHGRTPMPWSGGDAHAGFSTTEPWLGLIEAYRDINVEDALQDNNSIFYHYKELIAMRKAYSIISEGEIIPHLMEHSQLMVYERRLFPQRLLVITNFSKNNVALDLSTVALEEFLFGDMLLHNYTYSVVQNSTLHLRPYESLCFALI
ncbi:alpha,alpha-phosphotrehalase [Entomospira culicis]|uniref:Alpha,alpha-phosphotrehalase n=1 Tax=Entomospira culicis TaxID=2719989 RepID=A0A968GIP0_9SPIO|nr:alpha,alpha-phosphotrehalase [Entomospira culicis]NIZ19161.1 alpha,alpha-phosphotrehalase [Entomospira culicis]NIZ69375.1 alpha,alpha-phosphotrehalase [Entomospira culicis]WDI36492.1 alpha,alpha-phosphotrehalase [Entomospira culicis]WDI38118.1 alpha,alpha-phosphotrehalase [Entomospira culicis]